MLPCSWASCQELWGQGLVKLCKQHGWLDIRACDKTIWFETTSGKSALYKHLLIWDILTNLLSLSPHLAGIYPIHLLLSAWLLQFALPGYTMSASKNRAQTNLAGCDAKRSNARVSNYTWQLETNNKTTSCLISVLELSATILDIFCCDSRVPLRPFRLSRGGSISEEISQNTLYSALKKYPSGNHLSRIIMF